MKTKQMVLIAVLAVLSVLVLAGCGGGTGGPAESTAAPQGGNQAAGSSQPGGAGFKEYPIGDGVQVEGMNIAAVYFQPVTMVPEDKQGLGPDEADIHLEADITALKNHPAGFGFGQFVPYLSVRYELTNKDTGETVSGSFMPMNAGDGTHYGANIKMLGAGKYHLKYIIEAPKDFLLHTDEVTGVQGRFWKKPIVVEWDFSWLPRKW